MQDCTATSVPDITSILLSQTSGTATEDRHSKAEPDPYYRTLHLREKRPHAWKAGRWEGLTTVERVLGDGSCVAYLRARRLHELPCRLNTATRPPTRFMFHTCTSKLPLESEIGPTESRLPDGLLSQTQRMYRPHRLMCRIYCVLIQ